MEALVERFLRCYKDLSVGNLHEFKFLYEKEFRFTDPLGTFQNLRLLQNTVTEWIQEIFVWRIRWGTVKLLKPEVYIQWALEVAHPHLKQGKPQLITGHTELTLALHPTQTRTTVQQNQYAL